VPSLRALGLDPGEPERVNDWHGLERRHPGFNKFDTGDTGRSMTRF
jgi:hypothetical protein